MNPLVGTSRSPGMHHANTLSLDEHRADFARSPFLAMPIAGAIAWTAIGIAGWLLPTHLAAWALFIGTGMIFSLAPVWLDDSALGGHVSRSDAHGAVPRGLVRLS
jgi:hypothetical protein